MFANEPGEDIAYAGCHDNLNLWDRILAWAYDNRDRVSSTGYLKRIQMFGNGIILTSQGVAFIQEGDEFLRSKLDTSQNDPDWASHRTTPGFNPANGSYDAYYSSNSYNSPDAVNEIKWEAKATNIETFEYYKGMISMRNQHPAFKLSTW
jgi:pullulanase